MRDAPRILAGRFRLERELGRRRGAATWLAVDGASGRPCTVKEFRLSEAPAAEAVGTFEERARILARLSVPGIPSFVSFGCERDGSDTVCLLAQDYVPGESLAARLGGGRRAPEAQVVGWLEAAARVLAPLHRQAPPLLHGNLKPANVVLGADGAVHLVDVDFVRPLPADPHPLGFALPWLASPYEAPEAAAGKGQPSSDVYALGLIAAAALTGREPPAPADPHRVAGRLEAARVSPPLSRLLGRVTDPDPGKRPRDADDLLLELLALRSVGAPRPPRRRRLGRLALLVAAAGLLGLALPALRERPARRTPARRAGPGGAERRATPTPHPSLAGDRESWTSGEPITVRFSGLPVPGAAPGAAGGAEGAVVEGALLHDGRPVGLLTDLAPRFWFRNEGTGKVQEATATWADGRYRVTGLPEGTIGMSVRFDLEPGNPPVYPGDLDAWSTLRVPASGTHVADVALRRIIRLRAPIDNNALTPGGEEACGRGTILRSPVTFRWDVLGEGLEYAVRVSRMDCRRGYRSAGNAFETVTRDTEVAVPLPPSPDGECYAFHLAARRGDIPVGMLTTHGKDYLAWDVRFAVRR